MRRIDNPGRPGVALYELPDGRRFQIDAKLVHEYGITELLRGTEFERYLPTERTPVFQDGRMIGTMAPDFDPLSIKSKSFLYDPRPGDFRLTENGWVAASTLGSGDFEMIPGFIEGPLT